MSTARWRARGHWMEHEHIQGDRLPGEERSPVTRASKKSALRPPRFTAPRWFTARLLKPLAVQVPPRAGRSGYSPL